jgi:hypothetical protein
VGVRDGPESRGNLPQGLCEREGKRQRERWTPKELRERGGVEDIPKWKE